MQYLTSAIKSSTTETRLSLDTIYYLKWGVGIGFVFFYTVLSVAEMICFPGYYEPDGSTEQFNAFFKNGIFVKLYWPQ